MNKSLSFSQSIQATQSLMSEIETNKLNEAYIQKKVSSIVSTKDGGRGFFAVYLTSDSSLADYPSPGIINGLISSIEVAADLLVKNLAMSSAMAIAHIRNNDLTNARGSQRVTQRTSNLIKKIDIDIVDNRLKKLKNTIALGGGEYQNFLEHWKYNWEQKSAIEKAISDTFTQRR